MQIKHWKNIKDGGRTELITAMILAGGVGSRVGADRPKQFVEVLEKTDSCLYDRIVSEYAESGFDRSRLS